MSEFLLSDYYKIITDKITKLFTTNIKKTEEYSYDILYIENNIRDIILRDKQLKIKIGYVWQIVLGNYFEFEDLCRDNSAFFGIDIVLHSRKIIVELKNRTNTDNSSSRKANLDKLARCKVKYPEYLCIYGLINDSTQKKTEKGSIKLIKPIFYILQ